MTGAANSLIPNPVFETTAFALNGSAPRLQPGATSATRETAEDFEAFFLAQMFSQMFEGIDTDPVFGGGPGETMFRSLMVQEYGKTVAQNGGIGIADAVMRELISLQEEE